MADSPGPKKGKGLQRIADVDIYNERNWKRAHVETLSHAYARSPFFEDHIGLLEDVYDMGWEKLANLNVFLIRRLMGVLGIGTEVKLSSDLGVDLKATDLIIEICGKVGAETYTAITSSRTHLDEDAFRRNGLELDFYSFRCPGYPQLWGEFIPNLSVVDMLFNCGPKTLSMIEKAGH